MNLYEITTGRIGCSYQRCYVWAEGKILAAQMFMDTYPDSRIDEVIFLFSDDNVPFVTELSTDGFEKNSDHHLMPKNEGNTFKPHILPWQPKPEPRKSAPDSKLLRFFLE